MKTAVDCLKTLAQYTVTNGIDADNMRVPVLFNSNPAFPVPDRHVEVVEQRIQGYAIVTSAGVEIVDDVTAIGDVLVNHKARSLSRFTLASCSWLNAAETFFAKLTKRRLKHAVFHPIVDLQTAIDRLIKEANNEPKPFVQTQDER